MVTKFCIKFTDNCRFKILTMSNYHFYCYHQVNLINTFIIWEIITLLQTLRFCSMAINSLIQSHRPKINFSYLERNEQQHITHEDMWRELFMYSASFLICFLFGITPCKSVKPLRHKGLQGVEEVGTETLIMSGKRKRVIRRAVDSDWHCI